MQHPSSISDTSHIHVELYENYIPGLCAGLAVKAKDFGHPVSRDQYPVLSVLYQSSVNGLFRMASEQFGYSPLLGSYISKCELCTEIRAFLAVHYPGEFVELAPQLFYPGISAAETVQHD